MIRIVPDTTVLISGLLWSGLPGQIIRGAIEGRWELVTSETLLEELREVVQRPKFSGRWTALNRDPLQSVDDLLAILHVTPAVNPSGVAVRDPDDDPVIACALVADVDYLVTGDSDLLVLGSIGRIPVLTPRQFLDRVNNSDSLPK